VRAVVHALDAAGVQVIEVTHGDGLGGSSFNYGFSLVDDIRLVRAAVEEATQARIAVLMLPGLGIVDDLRRAHDAGASVARIATHCTEADVAFSLQGLLRRGTQPLLGIDVSASNIKLVELVPGGKAGMRLERYAIEPIERGAIVDGNVEKPEAVADALTRAIRRAGTRTRLAAMAMPSAATA
jgi:hypothetical protein